MRLVDVEVIEKQLKKEIEESDGYFTKANLSMLLDSLMKLPTIDAEPVVRCINCVFYEWYCSDRVSPYGFCSTGKQKEE